MRLAVLLFSLLALLTGCDQSSSADAAVSTTPTAKVGGWPRSFQTSKGEVTLLAPPQRIVSTSVTLTGSLLAISAPVVASASVRQTGGVTDENGFFTQWGAEAVNHGVKPLYRGEVNVDAVLAMQPDLILVSATGGDSALKAWDQLSAIAPVLVVNYDDKSWQDLSRLLGSMTGHEQDAEHIIAAFDSKVASMQAKVTLPVEPVTAMVYYEDGSGANVWTPESAQGQLLTRLGLKLAHLPQELTKQTVALGRRDIIPVSGERFSQALNGGSLLLFNADQRTADEVLANPLLTNLPAIRERKVYPLGIDTFRLDYYSASHLVERMSGLFAKQG